MPLKALRRLHRWLRINLIYACLAPRERREAFELVAQHWVQSIRLAQRLPSAPPRPCRVWRFAFGAPVVIGGKGSLCLSEHSP
jgi:hypothetical protein